MLTSGEKDGLAIAAIEARKVAERYMLNAKQDSYVGIDFVFVIRQRCAAYALMAFADWCDREIAKKD